MISVIICTYNRGRILHETVRSFLDCHSDGIDYELLLVDNNSTDETREFAESLAAKNPLVRYLFEPSQGLSYARNSGIRASHGQIVVFVDDDVYFSPNWLTAVASVFERHIDVACIGGKVVPHFDFGRPKWIVDNLLWIYGVTRYGDHEREIRFPEIPIGCNMAFRRTVFEQIGIFHTSLGRKGKNLLSGEENHFLLRTAKAGLKTIYSPDIQISHRIPAARTIQEWVLKRFYWEGISEIVMRQLDDEPLSRKALAKQAITTVFSLFYRVASLLTSRKVFSKSASFEKKLDICYKLGVLRQLIVESIVVKIRDAVLVRGYAWEQLALEETEVSNVSKLSLMKPIRVLFVSHHAGMSGGAQRTLLTLLTAIDRSMCTPMLVIPSEGALGRAAGELEIPVFIESLVYWVPCLHFSTSRQRLRHLYYFFRTLNTRSKAIERLIVEHGIDLVYTNTVTCVEGAIAAWRTRKSHVWHIHEPILGNSDLAPLLPYRLYSMAIDFLSEAIIFCSKSLANDYPELSGKASIVYNGLPIPSVRNRSFARMEITKKLDINAGAKIVAVVGGLQPRKDHLMFLDAAKLVTLDTEDAVFLIVGSGSEEYTNFIRERVSALQLDSRVRLLGWWEGDIHDFLAAIDVLVISSEQESFGLTAIEALAMETPVIATRCGGPEEVVTNGLTGLLVPVKDSIAMADAITKLLMEPELARKLGIMGREYVSETFGVDRYIKSIQMVIQGAVVKQSEELPRSKETEKLLRGGTSVDVL